MKFFNVLRDRLRALIGREQVIDDIDREMRLHVELQTEANLKSGMTGDEARREANRIFGRAESLRDAAYDVKGGGMLETIAQDIRYGFRIFAKHKGFTS